MGAAALLLADLADAGSFDQLVLFEPIVMPWAHSKLTAEQLAEVHKRNPLAKLARKRRFLFPSRPVAKEYFLTKALFQPWDPRAVDAYVVGGTMPTRLRYGGGLPDGADDTPPDARRLCLKCDRVFESGVFLGGHDGWDHLHRVRADALVVAGRNTMAFGGFSDDAVGLFRDVGARMPRSRFLVMEGCGHFGPMERPATLAQLAAEHFGWVGGKGGKGGDDARRSKL